MSKSNATDFPVLIFNALQYIDPLWEDSNLSSLRFTMTYAPTKDGWEVEPNISLRATITLTRVVRLITPDYNYS